MATGMVPSSPTPGRSPSPWKLGESCQDQGTVRNRSPYCPLSPSGEAPSSATMRPPRNSLLGWQEQRHKDAPLTHTAPPLALVPVPSRAWPWRPSELAPRGSFFPRICVRIAAVIERG